jgi:hypothetical protein
MRMKRSEPYGPYDQPYGHLIEPKGAVWSRMEALSELDAHMRACQRVQSTSFHKYIYLVLITGCGIILLHKNQLLRRLKP